jgi:hypothetical protein
MGNLGVVERTLFDEEAELTHGPAPACLFVIMLRSSLHKHTWVWFSNTNVPGHHEYGNIAVPHPLILMG